MVKRAMPGMPDDSLDLVTASKFTKSSVATVLGTVAKEWSQKLAADVKTSKADDMPVDEWIEKYFWVDRPRDTITSALYPPGPVRCAEYQRRILREAFRRDADGKFIYSTIMWSEPKKSGKTTIASAVGMYMGYHSPASVIYCLANDGKQSQDRILRSMDRCIKLHHANGGIFEDVNTVWTPPSFNFPNGTHVEAVPCDAAGEAGSEPLMTIWSEMWGFRQEHKERLWTEMTIPPTLDGYAMRWVESYAGYEDESTILWNLYDQGVNKSRRHPAFPDLPVYVNDASKQLTFWSHEPRMPWQTPEYYASESLMLLPNEFLRIHRNEWVTATTAFLDDMILWDKCKDDYKPLRMKGDNTPIVAALDASVSGDCSALIAVSRHPDDAWDSHSKRICVRYVNIWKPPEGGKLNYSLTMEPAVRELADTFNVYKFVYDPYQLHKMCTDLRTEGVGAFEEFSQTSRRLKADKQLYDMVIHRQLLHDGHPELRQHVMNAAARAESSSSSNYLRLTKKASGRPIDAAVALSMAIDECLRLNT